MFCEGRGQSVSIYTKETPQSLNRGRCVSGGGSVQTKNVYSFELAHLRKLIVQLWLANWNGGQINPLVK